MKKAIIITLLSLFGLAVAAVVTFFIIDNDVFDDFSDLFDSKNQVTTKKTDNFSKNKPKARKILPFQSKVSITKNKTRAIEFENYNNGLFSMQIPRGWVVGVSKSDFIHYTFMAYNPKNPDYKIFFNMKTEGYLKTQQMKTFYKKYYPTAPMAKLPVISPQNTEGFYKVFTQAFNLNQNLLAFKVPVIKNFKAVQTIGKNPTGGSIVRAVYQNEAGKEVEGIFTTTIKEFSMPPVVLLISYNTVFYTVPNGELIDWMPILNRSLNSIKFSDSFIGNYYKQQGQVVKNAQAIQAICDQTSNIITSGWREREKTYDILSQQRSDATMGYERVRDTETGEIYKATIGFSDHDWNGRYEPITKEMYNLPTAGYIEKMD